MKTMLVLSQSSMPGSRRLGKGALYSRIGVADSTKLCRPIAFLGRIDCSGRSETSGRQEKGQGPSIDVIE